MIRKKYSFIVWDMARPLRSKKILEALDKGMSISEVVRNLKTTRKTVNMVSTAYEYFLLGHPDYSDEDLRELSNEELNRLLLPRRTFGLKPSQFYRCIKLLETHNLKQTWQQLCETDKPLDYSYFCSEMKRLYKKNSFSDRKLYRPGGKMMLFWFDREFRIYSHADIKRTVIPMKLLILYFPFSRTVFTRLVHPSETTDGITVFVFRKLRWLGGTSTDLVLPTPLSEFTENKDMGAFRHMLSDLGIEQTVDRNHLPFSSHEAILAKKLDGIAGLVYSDKIALKKAINWSVRKHNRHVNRSSIQNPFKRERYVISQHPLPSGYPGPEAVKKNVIVRLASCHVRFDGKYYSCPFEYRGKPVEIHAVDKTVKIMKDGIVIAEHDRLFDTSQRYSTMKKHIPSERQMINANMKGKERYLMNASHLGESFNTLVKDAFENAEYEIQVYDDLSQILHFSFHYHHLIDDTADYLKQKAGGKYFTLGYFKKVLFRRIKERPISGVEEDYNTEEKWD